MLNDPGAITEEQLDMELKEFDHKINGLRRARLDFVLYTDPWPEEVAGQPYIARE
jgi:hypothetical protein